MAKLPDFELAELTAFDPNVFRSDAPDVDAFALSLALAFNDFKGIQYAYFQLLKGTPEEYKVDPYCGQFYGMKTHVTRLLLGFLHELLQAVRQANERGVIDHPQFRDAVSMMTPLAQMQWAGFLAVALGKDDEADTDFLKWLVQVRNNAVYHYYQPKALLRGYVKHFQQAQANSAHAYASLGATMKKRASTSQMPPLAPRMTTATP